MKRTRANLPLLHTETALSLSLEASEASKRALGNPNQADRNISYFFSPAYPLPLHTPAPIPKLAALGTALKRGVSAPPPHPAVPPRAQTLRRLELPKKNTLTSFLLKYTLDLPTASCPELP